MARELKATDIDSVPELVRLAEEVEATGEPQLLRRDGRDLAVITPIERKGKRRSRREKTEADYEAFRSAAGGWSDVDTDRLVDDTYESRRLSSRPPVEL